MIEDRRRASQLQSLSHLNSNEAKSKKARFLLGILDNEVLANASSAFVDDLIKIAGSSPTLPNAEYKLILKSLSQTVSRKKDAESYEPLPTGKSKLAEKGSLENTKMPSAVVSIDSPKSALLGNNYQYNCMMSKPTEQHPAVILDTIRSNQIEIGSEILSDLPGSTARIVRLLMLDG